MQATLRKFRLLFEKKDLRWFGVLFAAILGMAILEVVGIASILPFMHLVANPDLIHRNEWLNWIYTTMNFSSQRSMLLWTGGVVLALFAVSRLFSAFTTWLIHKCIWSIAHRLCMRLVINYAKLPYDFFLLHNSSELLKKVIIDVNNFVSGVLSAGCYFVAYTTLSLVIFLLLVIVEPTLALSAFAIFGGSYLLIYLAHHRYLKRLGEKRLDLIYVRLRAFSDTITGVKTIRSEGVGPFFIKRFEAASAAFSDIHPKYQFILTVPRFTIELLAFGAILMTVLLMLSSGKDFSETIPVLSLFALASYRLLPALTKAFNGAAQLSHYLPVINDVYSDLKNDIQPELISSSSHDGEGIAFSQQIQLSGVSFRYENTNTDVISDIDITILKHAKIAFIGSTGSGKSTLIDVMVGLLFPAAGSLSVDGVPITLENVVKWRRKIAYVPQDVFFYDDTITNNIAFGIPSHQIDMDQIHNAARLAQIDGFISEQLPDGYNTVIGERGVRLSGGSVKG